MNNYITGASTALITPFKNGTLDEATFAKLIQRQIDNGIDAVCPVGTTGESATLSHDEHKRCIEIAVEVCKNTSTKVLAGAGSNATHEAIDIAKHAEACGVIAEKYPAMKFASIGPTIRYPHSTREEVDLASVERTYKVLLGIIGKV